jgi:hypothetical protein
MSKAFTKEDDDSAEILPNLPQSPHPNYVTPEGLAALQDRLHKICAELIEARANKDRSNPDTHDIERTDRTWTPTISKKAYN